MNYGVEVYAWSAVEGERPIKTWQRMKPSNGPAYVYETREAAESSARMCYPDHAEDVRIVEVDS